MAREKVIWQRDPAPVVYTPERFTLLAGLRDEAMPVLACLGAGAVYGSLARGDVHKGSDVDIVLTHPPAAFSLEVALETGGFQVTHREIIMASQCSASRKVVCSERHIPSLIAPMESAGPAARRAAHSPAAPINSPSGTARLARPISAASGP